MEPEPVYVLIGGVPYRCHVARSTGLRPGFAALRLLEDVGDRATITRGEATTFFAKGTILTGRHDGEFHPTTGERCLRLVDPREAIKPAG
jgi:hypothetical protein